jgi:proteasome lid subunit RPN8/RPN11
MALRSRWIYTRCRPERARRARPTTGTDPLAPRPLEILRSVLDAIGATLGRRPAEEGGALGGSRADGIVRHFAFDASARRSGATYSPDHGGLNRLFADRWNPNRVNLLGFVHSHPAGVRRPSSGDLRYARDILDRIPELDRLLLPIVMTAPNTGRFELLPYAAVRAGTGVHVEALELRVLEDIPSAAVGAAAPDGLTGAFARVATAYDLARLARARVVCVGTGGAAAFIEDLTRAGVGEHILIDPDTIAEPNLATQQVYRHDLGRPKVEALAERILDINPAATVVRRAVGIEALDDAEVARLVHAPLGVHPPLVTLLGGFTNKFVAQARVNRLALHLGVPSLCAQVYAEGRGAEITFTVPGVTPACHRCALRSRYQAYLERGFTNPVTSDGTPIFATSRLNALKGFIAMAILHHGTEHPRWGSLLARIGKRNLVQIRMDPELALPSFTRAFAEADPERVLFDEAVWLPQDPDRPEFGFPTCPDCGGTGDLRGAMGTFADTRVMRRPVEHGG